MARHRRTRGVSLARALSKLGLASRAEATRWIRAGRVAVDGRLERDPTRRVDLARVDLRIDGRPVAPPPRVYLALHKPRGVVTTRCDERGRRTVYDLLPPNLPWVAPVGRLDKASEGLLLLTNDTRWAQRLLDPVHKVPRIYRVQVAGAVPPETLAALEGGVVDRGERLRAAAARIWRANPRSTWLEVVLTEGRNRQIRRMLASLGCEVKRLVRIAIGPVPLTGLPKGAWRVLRPEEVAALAAPGLARPSAPRAVGGASGRPDPRRAAPAPADRPRSSGRRPARATTDRRPERRRD